MPEKTITTSPRSLDLARRLKQEPGSRVFYELAREHHALGNHDEAARLCRDGLQKHPAYHSARVLFGRVLIDMGLFGEARPELERVVKQAPDNLLARRLLADALAGAGDRPGAVAALRQLLAIQPGDAEAEKKIQHLEAEPPAGDPAGVGTLPASGPEADGADALPAAEELAEAEAAPSPQMPSATSATEATVALFAPAPPPPSRPSQAPTTAMDWSPVSAGMAPPMMPVAPEAAVASTVMMTPEAPGIGSNAEEAAATVVMSPPAPALPPAAHETSVATVMMRSPFVDSPDSSAAPPAPAAAREPAAAPDPAPAPPMGEDDEPAVGALPTPTLAEIYLAQGMPERALQVYEAVLAGDPHNHEAEARIRELRARLAPQGGVTQRKIHMLEGWLGKIRRLKDVQDDA